MFLIQTDPELQPEEMLQESQGEAERGQEGPAGCPQRHQEGALADP